MRSILSVLVAAMSLACLACAETRKNESSEPKMASTRTDVELVTDVNTNLYGNGLKDVQVRAVNGEVILCGYVDSAIQKQRAEEIARTTPGVIRVNNYVTVGKRPPVNANKPGGPREKPCDF